MKSKKEEIIEQLEILRDAIANDGKCRFTTLQDVSPESTKFVIELAISYLKEGEEKK